MTSLVAVLIAVAALGALGLVFGVLLMGANKAFEMPSNPKKDAVRECLSGANCGGCGYAGCDALAEAIAEGKAPVNTCPVGGNEAAAQIAAIMGLEAPEKQVRNIATVLCQGTAGSCKAKFTYNGIQDCVAASLVNNGPRSCRFACLGLGTCVRTCKFNAISVNPFTGIASVNPKLCHGCGACVEACPKDVLSLQPETLPVRILCRAADKGFLVSDNCKNGCVGCEICKNACQFDAITIVKHLPVINREICNGCMMCAESCPTGALWGDFDHRQIADISRDLCVGCTLCKKVCKFNAISGELKHVHEINESCTGCGECAKKCPRKAIVISTRKHMRDANAKVGSGQDELAIPRT